ncbi:phage tail protein [Piscinibacter sp.]|uniref:phage tail protein n=1 Tax=Piscinibacter sp. TaxID=1903157 RepID=UPI002CB6A78B|nr:phage tail protein [Albitalea sp.]HUG26170.1 phage tail protein [Albitalea sp.]
MLEALGLYPPVAFHFSVSFGPLPLDLDSSFREVSGIGPEMETETVAEGGENRFVHVLPKAVKHPRLVLKRGISPYGSPLMLWCRAALEGGLVSAIEPKLVHLFLLNELSLPVRAWSFANAYPVKWEVDGFQATKNEVAVEKIELCYAFSKREV